MPSYEFSWWVRTLPNVAVDQRRSMAIDWRADSAISTACIRYLTPVTGNLYNVPCPPGSPLGPGTVVVKSMVSRSFLPMFLFCARFSFHALSNAIEAYFVNYNMVRCIIHQRESVKVVFYLYSVHAALGKWQQYTKKRKLCLICEVWPTYWHGTWQAARKRKAAPDDKINTQKVAVTAEHYGCANRYAHTSALVRQFNWFFKNSLLL